MELTKNFEPQEIEKKWYSHWMNNGYFKSVPNGREAYTIVMPPPNVTGVLHMGHCLNNTIQDILIRRARMQGKNACWVPGTDHASIATEAKVVAMLRERGITKSSLSREEFLKYAWEWKEKYGGIILEQLKKMGCSLDWDRTSFTMDPDYYKSVIEIFVRLHKDGIIYRGLRMVNWDPASKTALSDEEVIFKDIDSKLYYVTYPFADGSAGGITVATTRPETILGDVAICVNPTDERYISLIGKEVLVPIINRKIKIIGDEYVTAEFGTGALKVTPAHDKNDNELGKKHNLKALNTLDEEGKFTLEELEDDLINDTITSYSGVDRFVLRKKIALDIEAIGGLQKIEDYKSQVGTSERTGAVIESRLSLQWFMDMKKFIATNPDVAAAVADERIKFHPQKAKNTYAHWMDNIKDWCISRQLWWGQQIPAWYDEEGRFVVAENEEKAKEMFNIQFSISNAQLKQDEDCLDTWFSSWLWPMEVFKGISNPNNADINYYYPTTTLVTGQDIIFFWVARMVMAGYAFKQTQPFKDVYFTGMVRDKQGRKMSKQLGNSPDLLLLIEQYGADAVRFGIMIASPAGNDLLFDEGSLEQGRNFNNKLWNALKLIKTVWKVADSETSSSGFVNAGELPEENKWLPQPIYAEFAVSWFKNRLEQTKIELEKQFKDFKLSEALKIIYSLIWDDFCSWYLEWVKPEYGQPIDHETYTQTIGFFEELLLILHPYMPFITEEIYHNLEERNDDIFVKQLVNENYFNNEILDFGEILKSDITAIRDARKKYEIKNIEKLNIMGNPSTQFIYKNIALLRLLEKQTNTLWFEAGGENIVEYAKKDVAINSSNRTFFLHIEKEIDKSGQKETLEKELAHLKGFLVSVEKKLGNEKFVANAKPEVLAIENKKKADALEKIEIIEDSLKSI